MAWRDDELKTSIYQRDDPDLVGAMAPAPSRAPSSPGGYLADAQPFDPFAPADGQVDDVALPAIDEHDAAPALEAVVGLYADAAADQAPRAFGPRSAGVGPTDADGESSGLRTVASALLELEDTGNPLPVDARWTQTASTPEPERLDRTLLAPTPTLTPQVVPTPTEPSPQPDVDAASEAMRGLTMIMPLSAVLAQPGPALSTALITGETVMGPAPTEPAIVPKGETVMGPAPTEPAIVPKGDTVVLALDDARADPDESTPAPRLAADTVVLALDDARADPDESTPAPRLAADIEAALGRLKRRKEADIRATPAPQSRSARQQRRERRSARRHFRETRPWPPSPFTARNDDSTVAALYDAAIADIGAEPKDE